MRGPGAWWRGKSTPAKVETYTRWSFHSFPLIEVGSFGVPLFGQVPLPQASWMFALMCGHGVLGSLTGARALDWVRGTREQPLRLMWAVGVVSMLIGVAAFVLVTRGVDDEAATALGAVFGGVLVFGVGMITLGIRRRRTALYLITGFAAGSGVLGLLLGAEATNALAAAIAVLLGTSFFAFTSVFSVWLLKAVYELDAARETRARLAVAEERLRFGRDLHDVIGRNLAVIALKSELAVQLARRERPEAVEQMVEVQRIAQESQREVRDVVRGYREADLGVELAGAQGVLEAAGIDCSVDGDDTAELPGEVQSALAWVVREGTTNVLRHGNAGQCAVSLRVTAGQVVLTLENDMENGEVRGAGSGLAGLRERLAIVDGTLQAGPVDGDAFRVVATVPLTSAGAGPAGAEGTKVARGADVVRGVAS
ncbi:sensor histidine kinase [Streptomyces capitiformicae]|uniref:Histidine kinase n=1 Tax=Streptomyces capitiformicae TaxID=2014920 RepID=A0A919GEF2_9ACTN|nr:histidine kinase [Streptomyces capitiformicae]GHH83123.1 histidine kinase [Streptomyces capitiformicae]